MPQHARTRPDGVSQASVDEFRLEAELAFFRRTRLHAIVGMTSVLPLMVTLSWDRVDHHAQMLAWTALHWLSLVAVAISFYVPFRREPLTRFPRSAVVTNTISLTIASSTIFVVGDGAQDLAVLLSIGAVMFAIAAGVTLFQGPIRPMARPALFAAIVPLSTGGALNRWWVAASASAVFLLLVVIQGLGATMEWFDELAVLRAESAQRENEAQLAARTDRMTGLVNRQGLAEATSRPYRSTVTGVFIDLDGFKQVNDQMGHLVGDELLTIVASRILGEVRKTDVVARLGGDEFFIVVEQFSESEALELAQRVIGAISKPIAFGSATAQVSASVGLATQTGADFDLGKLLQVADEAMYEAKRNGRNQAALGTDSARSEAQG